MPVLTDTSIQRGGEWLLQATDADAVFTPERMTDEHRLIAQTAQEFVENEILPKLDQLEQKDWALARDLVKRSGALGLLGVDVPEAYGGVGLDKVSSLIVSDRFARAASFHAAMLSTVSAFSVASSPVARLRRISSISLISVCWNGFTFQNRSGVGPSLSSVGSKMQWSQRCASS